MLSCHLPNTHLGFRLSVMPLKPSASLSYITQFCSSSQLPAGRGAEVAPALLCQGDLPLSCESGGGGGARGESCRQPPPQQVNKRRPCGQYETTHQQMVLDSGFRTWLVEGVWLPLVLSQLHLRLCLCSGRLEIQRERSHEVFFCPIRQGDRFKP